MSWKAKVRGALGQFQISNLRFEIGLICLLVGGGLVYAEWKQAVPGYEFEFARDHASHPDYKIEWWYYTGNLSAADGRRFGYQLTFFRFGVDRQPKNPSRWAVRDLYMAHFAVTDVSGRRFQYAERLNRAGVGWAGASDESYRVWNEDWEARLGERGQHVLRANDIERGIALELELEPGKPPVLHGERGYSQKGSERGNASNYYSLTRMPTRGVLAVGGERVEVTGSSWMDHEFGTSFLEPEQRGWDWVSLQLDDGTELMIYQFRRTDGARDAHSRGTLVDARGSVTPLGVNDFVFEPAGETWASAASGAAYPTAWRVKVPSRGLELTVRAAVEDQELNTGESTGVTYWEGAVEARGARAGQGVGGRGYLEMTGYAGATMGSVLGGG
jgi:predicted secreted hydrolase